MKVGVLALQGDVREHFRALEECGVNPVAVRRSEEIEAIDALILPGGESTTIAHLAKIFGIFTLLKNRIREGMPTYGSCAGMILLADRIEDAVEGQESLGGLDITVRRNAFGRQIDSFETDLFLSALTPPPLRAVFIRAPWVEQVGSGVEVLASISVGGGSSHAVAVRQGPILATSFHPELTGDNRIHRFFIEQVCKEAKAIK